VIASISVVLQFRRYVRLITDFPAGWYPGISTSDQRFWQVRFLGGSQ